MYVNRPVTAPIYLPSAAQPAAYPPAAPPAPTAYYNQSAAGSDPIQNMKVLATNVWTWLKGLLQSALATLQSASQPHA